MLMKLTTGVNFINLFMSVKIQLSCQYLFVLLGSAQLKAERKILINLTPDFSWPLSSLFF